jgi:hypothetical protein
MADFTPESTDHIAHRLLRSNLTRTSRIPLALIHSREIRQTNVGGLDLFDELIGLLKSPRVNSPYGGRLLRRAKSWKSTSERKESKAGSILTPGKLGSRSRYAFSSQASAGSFSLSPQ